MALAAVEPVAHDVADSRIRVLLADDHALIRVGLALLIDEETDMRVIAAKHGLLDPLASGKTTA